MQSKFSIKSGVISALSEIHRTITRSVTVSVSVVVVAAVLLRLGYVTGKHQGRLESISLHPNTLSDVQLENKCLDVFKAASNVILDDRYVLESSISLRAVSDYESLVFCSVAAKFKGQDDMKDDSKNTNDFDKISIHNFALVDHYYGIAPITQEQMDRYMYR